MAAYDADCPLCTAAHDWANGTYADAELTDVAKKHGVTATLLKRRLGIGSARHTWTETEVNNLQSMVNEGATVSEIAQKYSISRARVSQLFSKFKIDTTSGRVERARRDATQAAEAAESILAVYLADPLLTPGQIAEKTNSSLGIQAATVGQVEGILKAMSLEISRQSQPPAEHHERAVEGLRKQAARSSGGGVGVMEQTRQEAETQTIEVPDSDDYGNKRAVEWVADYLAEIADTDEEPSMEKYGQWAKTRGGPTTTEVRHECKSWKEAKRQAYELL